MTRESNSHSSAPSQPQKQGKGNKMVFGLGAVSEILMQNCIIVMMFPFFNVALGVSPALLGVGTFLFRIWDAATDPFMGIVSDRTESRWGRRKPYIFLGAVLSAICFVLMWWCPRGMSPEFYFGWFLLIGILCYTSFTVFTVPYVALGYELSSDYHERTWIMSYRNWFASIGGIFIQTMFWMTQRSCFIDTVDGMRWISVGVGGVMLVCGVAPAFFLSEQGLSKSELEKNRKRIKIRSMFGVLRVKEFRCILWTLVSSITGIFLVISLGFYINVYYIFSGDLKAASLLIGVAGVSYHISCMASTPLIAWTSTKVGKKNTILLYMSLGVVVNLGKWWLYTPANPWLQLICTAMLAPGISAIWTLLASMTADVTDLDEMKTGVRREASFSAIYGWTMKIGFALCSLISGFILVKTGFDVALGGEQSSLTLFEMRLLYAVVPSIGILVGILTISRYSITERSSTRVRNQLYSRSRAE